MNPPATDCAARRSAVLGGTALLLLIGAAAAMLGPRSAGPAITRELATLRIDPNRASAAELMLLPGIGEQLAAEIIRYRDSQPAPAFRCVADLDAVPRIGPAICERVGPQLTFPPASAAPAGEPAGRDAP